MSCMMPCAPREETAPASKRDSRKAIAAMRFGSTRYFADASLMIELRYCGTGSGKEVAASCGRACVWCGAAEADSGAASATAVKTRTASRFRTGSLLSLDHGTSRAHRENHVRQLRCPNARGRWPCALPLPEVRLFA